MNSKSSANPPFYCNLRIDIPSHTGKRLCSALTLNIITLMILKKGFDIEKSNMVSKPQKTFLTSCANKKDQVQHMQLLSLVSIIDIACVNKEVLHTYLLNALSLDS